MMKTSLLAVAFSCAVSAVSFSASAGQVTSLVGDIDGFGGQTAPNAVGVDTGYFFDRRSSTDPLFTDAWLLQQNGGPGGSPVKFDFSYNLLGSTALSATMYLMESGLSDGRGPWNVIFNGHLVGSIANGLQSTATLHSFTIDTSWLTGDDAVSLVYQDTQAEGYAIDYSSLSIETGNAVPEPASLALIGLGLAGIAMVRRRKA